MKRRSFLASLASLVAAPFVARKVAADPVPAVKPYVVEVDWSRDVVAKRDGDRSSVSVVRVGPEGKEHDPLFLYMAKRYPNGHCARRLADPSYFPVV